MYTKINVESYLDYYNKTIAPKLKEIDIFIKTSTLPLNQEKMSKLLYISQNELQQIIISHSINLLEKQSFFDIMKHGSSEICQLFSRELQCGIPKIYTPHNISYIYNIDIDTILDACKNIGIVEFNSFTLKLLFSEIEFH